MHIQRHLFYDAEKPSKAQHSFTKLPGHSPPCVDSWQENLPIFPVMIEKVVISHLGTGCI